MSEFDVDGVTYRANLLSAMDQWKLYRRLVPLLPGLVGMEFGIRSGTRLPDMKTLLQPLMHASDEDTGVIFATCRGACQRKDGDAWRPVGADIPFLTLLAIVLAVASLNFTPFFELKRPSFTPIWRDGVDYTPVRMPLDEDWMFRPVLRRMCDVSSLYNGAVRLEHVAKMNDCLDVEEENQRRARKAMEDSRRA